MLSRLTIICSLLIAPVLVAQITISSTDVLNLIGTTQTIESDTVESITVDLGSAGENQSWDFSNLQVPGISTAFEYLSPTGTPFAADFPQANFLQFLDASVEDTVSKIYIYSEVNSNFLVTLGSGFEFSQPDFDTMYTTMDSDSAPLPLTFGTEWSSISRDTTDLGQGLIQVDFDSSKTQVDAWGSITLPGGGTIECLRLRDDNTNTFQQIFNGMVVFSQTTSDISYTWIGKNNFILAEVTSQDGETDPNFTDAADVSVARISGSTNIADQISPAMIREYTLEQNYPNPFNPETSIKYSLRHQDFVQIAIYDQSGRLITNLVNAAKSAGSHEVIWNGRDSRGNPVASGTYFYTLRIGDENVQTRQMILLK